MLVHGKHRPPHIYEAGAIYFLSASTLQQQPLFDTDRKKSILRECLKEAAKKYLQSLKAWVIIDWHYHLLATVKEERDLPRFIKSFHGSSAIQLNRLDGVTGRQVWYQYWDRMPRSEADYWTFFNYIHLNPIKHKLITDCSGINGVGDFQSEILPSESINIVQILTRYEFSSFSYYVRTLGVETVAQLLVEYPIRVALEFD